jgi:hypothetical protein
LRRYHRSQLSQREFAQREGLVLSTLLRWLRQERTAEKPPMRFQEVIVPTTPERWALEVVSPQGWTVRVQRAADLPSVSAVLSVLPC